MMPYIRHQFENRQPIGTFHRRALDYFRQYLIVGGMPQAVAKYVETRNIIALYRNDIRKYADSQETKVTAIFEEIPGQLQKHEKKFRLSALQDEARMHDYSDAFFWLSDAKIGTKWTQKCNLPKMMKFVIHLNNYVSTLANYENLFLSTGRTI